MADRPWSLGVSYSHNGAACLLRGEDIVVAVQEERLTGQKRAPIDHHERSLAVRYCLDHAGLALDDVDVLTACQFSSPSTPPLALRPDAARLPRRYLTIPHHLGHAWGAFATSGFDAAAVLVIDGQGGIVEHLPPEERALLRRGRVPGQVRETEVISIYWADRRTGTLALVEKHTGELMPGWTGPRSAAPGPRSLSRFGSLGGMFSAVADLVFGDPLEAGKVMGLAAHGRPRFPVSALLAIDDAGCLHYPGDVVAEFRDLAPWPANAEHFADLAASVQAALEHAVVALAERACRLTGARRLCYAGGVALNSIANERLHTRLDLDDIYLMPAAEDSGTAIGAAYHGLAALIGGLPGRRLVHDSVGRRYSAAEVEHAIARTPHVEPVACGDVLDAVVDWLCAGEIIGWFDGGSELGPRALGQRSILCDARRADAKQRLNDRVKHREAFRPFAPVILLERVAAWFCVPPAFRDSPAMLRVLGFLPGCAERVPAAAHVDGTGRVQTVAPAANPALHALVSRFERRTGVPILVNTSFNVAGEPIVETPDDALWCLLATDLDAVVLDGRLVRRAAAQRSLLALYPRLTARGVALEFPVVDGALRWRAAPESVATITAVTRYGEHAVAIRASELRLLGLCDGTRSGFELLDQLGRPELTEAQLARRLGYFRRAQVLALDAAPRMAAGDL